jgi:hypothetical protein
MRRIRLRDLKAQAQQTMTETQALVAQASQTLTVTERALLKLVEQLSAAIVVATDGVEEVMDGLEAEGSVEIGGKVLPIKGRIKVKFREEPIEPKG